MKTHYTIPFFVHHKGCPYKCVFCDQNKITGQGTVDPKVIAPTIERYLATIPLSSNAHVEVGFFGGTFTGISMEAQEKHLAPVRPFLDEGRVHGVRLSTRPDFINPDILVFLKRMGVTCIELGAQSMSDKVLSVSRRGHTAKDTETASRMIIHEGFMLGYQMMLGLPSSTPEDEYYTAVRARELGAMQVRIYPVIVMKGTELAEWWSDGKYISLSQDEATERTARLIIYFDVNDIKVIRCGLHPSEGLLDGRDYLSGPFHQGFRQKAESRIFALLFDHILNNTSGDITGISFHPEDEAYVFGFRKENLAKIKSISGGKKDFFKKDTQVSRGSVLVGRKDGYFVLDKKTIAGHVLPKPLLSCPVARDP